MHRTSYVLHVLKTLFDFPLLSPPSWSGMELFASCLWHLRCDVELSVLTDSLLTSDPSRVEGACAKATSLNLARDHEGAVKCLQRAISVSHS